MPPQFQLISKIEEGYTSVVWQCLDTAMQRTIAVKFLKDHNKASSEVRMLGRFGHPNVVKMLDCFEWKGLIGIVMPIVDMDLHRYLHSELYDTSTMCEISRQSARGLHHLHMFDALHADLKPENIGITVVNDDGTGSRRIHVHLLDFGSSKRLIEIQPGTVVQCTRGYQAPEILEGGLFTSAVDVWALGRVYEELIEHAIDTDDARRFQGQLTCDMLQASYDLRPTARDVLRRLGDGYQLVWENGYLVPSERLLWIDHRLWTSSLANLSRSAAIFDHLIINDVSHPLHRIAALAQSTTRIVQLENAFWLLREAAAMEQDGVVFETTVMSCIRHFHAHVDTTW